MKPGFLLYFFLLPTVFACTEEIKVGADFGWPPYSYIEEGDNVGLDIKIARHVLSGLDYCIRFSAMPSATRAMEEIKNGNIDLVLAASYSDERATLGGFSIPYRYESVILFSHVENNNEAVSVATLFELGTTFAVNRGSYIGEDFASLIQKYPEQVIYLNTMEKRLLLLNNGRVDFVVEDLYAGKHFARQNGFNRIRATEHVVYQNPIHFLTSKSSFTAEKLNDLNLAIENARPEIKKLNMIYLQGHE